MSKEKHTKLYKIRNDLISIQEMLNSPGDEKLASTCSKTITGAINELKTEIDVEKDINNIIQTLINDTEKKLSKDKDEEISDMEEAI